MKKKSSKNTKGKIVSAAWQLFYQQGYDDTTIDEIVEASGTSKGLFITISTVKTPFSLLFLICSTKNTKS